MSKITKDFFSERQQEQLNKLLSLENDCYSVDFLTDEQIEKVLFRGGEKVTTDCFLRFLYLVKQSLGIKIDRKILSTIKVKKEVFIKVLKEKDFYKTFEHIIKNMKLKIDYISIQGDKILFKEVRKKDYSLCIIAE